MHVLVVGQTRRWFSASNLRWVDDTVRALRRLRHRVSVFAYREPWAASPSVARWAGAVAPLRTALARCPGYSRRATEQRLVALARRAQPDLTLVLKGECLSMETLSAVKRHTQGPCVSWWVDDPWRYPAAVECLPVYDDVFVFDQSYIPPLLAAGVRNAHFLPCACDETVYAPMRLSTARQARFACDVSFVAWCYPEREAVVRALAGELEMAVWGGGWGALERHRTASGAAVVRGRAVDTRTAAAIYNASKIGLNIHAAQTRQAGLNTRTFELLACGAFQLVDRVPGMEALLDPGRELVCYESPEHARQLAKMFLADPSARCRIAAQGRGRVLAEHTYTVRMRRLCALAGGTT